MHRHSEDESLRRYKEALLGKDALEGEAAAGPKRVEFHELRLRHQGGEDIEVPVERVASAEGNAAPASSTPSREVPRYVVKEVCPTSPMVCLCHPV